MRPRPCRKSVGAEARMDHRQGRFESRILQVRVKLGQLPGIEHTLVNQRLGRQAGNVKHGAMAGLHRLDFALHIRFPAREKFLAQVWSKWRRLEQVLDAPANDVQLTLEGQIFDDRGVATDENLSNGWHRVPRGLAQWRWINRHRPPTQHRLLFFANHALKGPLTDLPAALLRGEKHKARAILT